jgi:AcrR family transcriptional regulator
VTEEEVLAAAHAVLLEKGARATAADVAARLGVGVATIFRRFPRSGDLFQEALSLRPPAWLDTLPELVGRDDLRATLRTLAGQVLDYYRGALPLLTMELSSPRRPSARNQRKTEQSLRMLVDFFGAEIRAGRVVLADPEFAARLFVGALSSHVLLGGDKGPGDAATGAFVEPLLDVFCGGPTRRSRRPAPSRASRARRGGLMPRARVAPPGR